MLVPMREQYAQPNILSYLHTQLLFCYLSCLSLLKGGTGKDVINIECVHVHRCLANDICLRQH